MRNKSEHDRFPIVKRGYDPDIVEQHIDEITAQTDETLDEAAEHIVALQGRIEEFQRNEEAVRLTILAATEAKEKMLAVASQQADDLKEEGRKAGDAIMTEARMQAFQVVTEARKEAEGIVAEAIAEAAAVTRTLETAPEPVAAPSDREPELEAQIARMQTVIADMEAQLRSRPTEPEPRFEPAEPADGASEMEVEEAPVAEEPEPEPVDEPADDLPPAPAASIDELESDVADANGTEMEGLTPDAEVDEAEMFDEAQMFDEDGEPIRRVKRSFYSRRSAKLPRIGAEGGRGAIAAVAGLRPHMSPDEISGDADETESEETPEFETV